MNQSIKNTFAGMQRVAVATLCVCALLFMASGCETKKTDTVEDDDELDVEFCSCLNTEDLGKTIPIVDEFLAGLAKKLDDGQKMQALAAWLKAQPCIIDASVLCQSCAETDPPKSEILISFDENGTTKDFVLDISMGKPLKVVGYREYKPEEPICSFLNTTNIDKTIPLVDGFLAGLYNELNNAQKLHKLADWLKGQICIMNASVVCQSCVGINPPTSEILISFDEGGETKEFILEVSMSNSLKAVGYRVFEKPDANYPTTIYRLPAETLLQLRSDFQQRNPYVTSTLNQFSFCSGFGTSTNIAGGFTREEAIAAVKEFVARNPEYTGVNNPDDLEFRSIGFDGDVNRWRLRTETQKINNIEVFGAEVFFRIQGYTLYECSGNYYPNVYVPEKYTFDMERAKSLLLGKEIIHPTTWTGPRSMGIVTDEDLQKSDVIMTILPLGHHIKTDEKIELRVTWNILLNTLCQRLYVDVMTGEIIFEHPTLIY